MMPLVLVWQCDSTTLHHTWLASKARGGDICWNLTESRAGGGQLSSLVSSSQDWEGDLINILRYWCWYDITTLMTLYGNKQNRIIGNTATFICSFIILGEVLTYICNKLLDPFWSLTLNGLPQWTSPCTD